MQPFTVELTRGADFTVGLEAVVGDPDGATASMVMKRDKANGPLPTDPVAATFTPTYVASVNGGGPGFLFGLTKTQTATLAPGLYEADAVVDLASGVVAVTQTLQIRVRTSVTPNG